jgi:uncharacterized protein YlxP (DUF503 family)
VAAYVCLLEVRLSFPDVADLKAKRKRVHSLKAQLRQRFGVAVAETDGHDKWQRATLVCALVGDGDVRIRADQLQRFVESRFPTGCAFDRRVRTLADLEA